MSTYTKEGTTIEGAKLVGEARRISDPVTIAKTGKHKAQRIVLRDNALCCIAKKYRFIK